MATKHEQILQYIEKLPVGEKISVRRIAKELQVSEGTAYRAIKEAEVQRLVSTIERVGTIRIERKNKENIERLTYAEIVNIVDGQVLGGRAGLHKSLTKFVIGAMQLDDMMRYTEAGNLLIVGNRYKAHEYALQAGAAVLVTGGFEASDTVKKLADEYELPVISTSYDTFTVATMINRAIYDQLIKKEILLIEDILIPLEETHLLNEKDTISRYHEKNEETSHGGFPVVDDNGKLVGIITSRDVMGHGPSEMVEKVMTKDPITVSMQTSVAAAGHRMIWEGIDLLPVANEQGKLKGVISRQDVLKAIQTAQRQPQQGETIDDIIKSQMTQQSADKLALDFKVTPQMTNAYGSISYGAYSMILIEAATAALKTKNRKDSALENMTVYYLNPVQLDSTVSIKPVILDISRKSAKVDVEVTFDNKIVGKALLTFQLLDR
ncbi:putative transcriptional regulator [Planomicrobium koreense]|uniref:Putative transcriptional regulator n=1 Tax=Planococcus koreensis TaxID=112331 RepID=A0A7W8CUH1_9BACL|nr:DRTGG domain-containing protein [Planococcus koreensis]MBB5180634.1 putative transcriptional regulator [Planococcus koreensis]